MQALRRSSFRNGPQAYRRVHNGLHVGPALARNEVRKMTQDAVLKQKAT